MYKDAVARGAALLDQQQPGWEAKIDTEGLHLDSLNMCILGQLFGTYEVGLGKLPEVTCLNAITYGFRTDFFTKIFPCVLEDQWRIQIEQRKSAQSLAT